MAQVANVCRIYPTRRQRGVIERTIDCCRWVYNKANELHVSARENRTKHPSLNQVVTSIPAWKKERPWLAEADSMALQQAARDNDRAWKNRFKNPDHFGVPSFKSKREHRASYRTNGNGGAVRVTVPKRGKNGRIRLPKVGEVKAKISRAPVGRILSATVLREPSGAYYVSLLCEVDDLEPWPVPTGAPEVTGVDMGLKDLATTSDGKAFENPKAARRLARKLAREQRRLSRRKKGSANYEKQRVKVARASAKAANVRRDALHKATTTVVRESQAVAVEDLNVKGMARNRNLAYSVHDAGMGEALRMLEYKCAWRGRRFLKVARTYASTQHCSSCGAKSGPVGVKELSVRAWECPECGAVHDRDVNAARNIAKEGARLLALEDDGTAGRAGTQAANAA